MLCSHKIVRKSGLNVLEIECSGNLKLEDKKCLSCIRARGDVGSFDLVILKSKKFSRVYSKEEAEGNKKKVKGVVQPFFVRNYFKKTSGEVKASYEIEGGFISIINGEDNNPVYVVKPKEMELSINAINSINELFDRIIDEEFLGENVPEARKKISDTKIDEDLKDVLARYSIGFGVFELLFRDPKIQDVFVDSPCTNPVHVVHEDFGECDTNIYVSEEELDKIASKLRIRTGRPFDASNPIFNGAIEEYGVRVSGIREPLTFDGIAFAFRKHSAKPFTLSRLVKNGTMSSEAAGLLSFLVDGESAILIVGARGSGKTSLMSSLLLEIPKNYRTIIVEDTKELPVKKLRHLGFKIQHVRTRATDFERGYELSTTDAIRSALRLGESALVIGEVRGEEARALFEAMRIGSAGRVVLGTIHGSSAYDAFDRVVNDLKVEKTSFKATDIVVSMAGIRTGTGSEKKRRLVGITEVRKKWSYEPQKEGAFHELAEYKQGQLFVKGIEESEVIARIAFNKNITVKEAKEELNFRKNLIQTMADNDITDAASVIDVKNEYNKLKTLLSNKNNESGYKLLLSKLDGFIKSYDKK